MANQMTILLVDDDPDILGLVSKQLLKNNYLVKIAGEGQKALDMVKTIVPDLVLLDLNLPKMNGYEVCKKIKMMDQTAHIPVIFITGESNKDTITRAFQVGGEDYIAKPFTHQELLARVNRTLECKKHKHQLENSEKQLRDVLQSSPDLIFSVTQDGEIIYTNVKTADHKNADNYIYKSFPQMSRKKWLDSLMHACCHDVPVQFEMNHSEDVCYDVRIHSIPSQAAQKTALVILTDITERKNAERDLVVSQKRYQLLLESQSDGVVLVNSSSCRIEFCNQAAASLFNQSIEEMLRRDLNDFIPSLIYESILDRIRDYQLQEYITFETTYRYGDNQERNLLVTVSNHPSVQGEVSRYCFVIRDLTVRIQIRNQLRFQLLWEKTATALTKEFINQPLHEIAPSLQNALMHINDFLKSTRCYVVQYDETFQIQQLYTFPVLKKNETDAVNAQIQHLYHDPQQCFRNSDIYLLHHTSTLAESENSFLSEKNLNAHLGCSLFNPDLRIMLCVDWEKVRLDEIEKFVPFMRIATEIFSNVLTRVKVEDTLAVYRNHLEQLVQSRTNKLDRANKNLRQEVNRRKLIEKELEQFNHQLRHLSSHLITVREQERAIVAREIHDELGQTLTALNLDVGWLAARSQKDAPFLYEHIDKMSGMVVGTMKKVQQIISNLRPTILDNLGLVEAVEWQINEYQKRTAICFQSNIDKDIHCSDELAIVIFRICQEGMTNIIRHSRAENAHISLKKKADQLVLTITDDGVGLPAEKLKEISSFGLMGMHERAHSCNGVVDIRAKKGTQITVTFPINTGENVTLVSHSELIFE